MVVLDKVRYMFTLSRLLSASSTAVISLPTSSCLPAAIAFLLSTSFSVRKGSLHILADISIASIAYDRHSLIHMPLAAIRGDVVGMTAID